MPDSIAMGAVPVDYTDVMLDLIMGYECNVKCDYCSITDDMRHSNMTTREIIGELVKARQLGIHAVSFGGGEPTIRRDFLPLVAYSRDRGWDMIKVSSNGLMYSYPEFAKRAVEAGVTQFNISAMGHTPALYESIMGRRDYLDRVEAGVANLIDLGKVPVLDLIIKNDTVAQLTETIEYWASRGVDTFPLWLVSLTDRNATNVESLPRVSDIKEHLFRAFEFGRKNGLNVYSRHIPRCVLPGYEDFVRDLREDRVYIVTPRSSFFLWESDISANTYVPKCESCVFVRGVCQGIRRDYLERFGDAEIVPSTEK